MLESVTFQISHKFTKIYSLIIIQAAWSYYFWQKVFNQAHALVLDLKTLKSFRYKLSLCILNVFELSKIKKKPFVLNHSEQNVSTFQIVLIIITTMYNVMNKV